MNLKKILAAGISAVMSLSQCLTFSSISHADSVAAGGLTISDFTTAEKAGAKLAEGVIPKNEGATSVAEITWNTQAKKIWDGRKATSGGYKIADNYYATDQRITNTSNDRSFAYSGNLLVNSQVAEQINRFSTSYGVDATKYIDQVNTETTASIPVEVTVIADAVDGTSYSLRVGEILFDSTCVVLGDSIYNKGVHQIKSDLQSSFEAFKKAMSVTGSPLESKFNEVENNYLAKFDSLETRANNQSGFDYGKDGIGTADGLVAALSERGGSLLLGDYNSLSDAFNGRLGNIIEKKLIVYTNQYKAGNASVAVDITKDDILKFAESATKVEGSGKVTKSGDTTYGLSGVEGEFEYPSDEKTITIDGKTYDVVGNHYGKVTETSNGDGVEVKLYADLKEVTTTTTTTTTETTTTTSITPTICGDINLDGYIDIADAVLLDKYIFGSVSRLPDEAIANAECYSDGNIDSKDSAAIAAFLAGNIITLPV